MKDTGVVNIHGKLYKTVAKRIDEFRNDHKDNLSVLTELVESNDNIVIMKATITDKDGRAIATGYAEEKRNATMINKTSALENCETSAIGRALANFGYGGGEYASADEVANAISQQAEAKPAKPNKPTEAQLNYIKSLAKNAGKSDEETQAILDKMTSGTIASATIKKMKEQADANAD